jgi:hypothetical protein
MSATAKIAASLRDRAVDACWSQWSTLAAEAAPTGRRPVSPIIDPEALVLMSLALRSSERRLEDRLRWWAGLGAPLMSLQRMRTLLPTFPDAIGPDVAWFAAEVVRAGDRRWRALAGDHPPTAPPRRTKGPPELQLLLPATLMLRLRAGIGVSAKADLLAFLIGMVPVLHDRNAGSTAAAIARATSWSVASVRRAAGELALARLLTAGPDRPTEYSIDVGPWARLLQLHGPYRLPEAVADAGVPASLRALPAWRFWAQMSAFVAACLEWQARWCRSGIAPVVRASHARDVAERYRGVLVRNGMPWCDPKTEPGERYLPAFHRLISSVADWLEQDGHGQRW